MLSAAGIRKSSDQFFRFLGQSAPPGDANDAAMVASARSFRTLIDPVKLLATPSRVKVMGAPKAGSFRSVVGSIGNQGADLDETSILNNADPDGEVRVGELLKIVLAGKH